MKTHISKIFNFSMAHRLTFHNGKCRNLHGHTYKLEITISGDINKNGIIIDFGDLKEIVIKNIIDKLDHSTAIYEKDSLLLTNFPKVLKYNIFPYETTAENLSKWIFDQLTKLLKIEKVRLWETPSNQVTYTK
ncbi:MAG: 6-carboxytetrahydropterin synthase QueD [Candidatus Marinimicrobia bacterium]|jgi:6-pyruvoyltetrahydropterin/6-carboxytetrahydropterin synthase|nr:6-carboxytetrahydropterin synthase QueD [Candidatus Neomarinimicrobiota bacterium]